MWGTGIFFSITLLLFIFYNVDYELLKKAYNSISWTIFIFSIFVLLLEGFFTALRFKLFTPNNPSFINCLDITAIFIVSLIVLPARLGEIAAIFLIKNKLRQSTGASIMNVLTQRFIDLFFLGAILLLFIIAHQTIDQSLWFYISITIIISLLLISIYKLDVILGCISFFILKNKNLKKILVFKKLLRMLLQARIWFRFHINHTTLSKAIIISSFKWVSNIGGLSLLFYSVNIPLSNVQLILTSAAYNLLAIIPIQTIGGFGVSEAGLTGILAFFGLPLDLSASISIICRLVLISIPFIFFVIIYSYILFNPYEKNSR
jgi:uncharacterized protein (TIRG00374 family)